MKTLLKKLSSRKLWACIVGVAVGLATAFGLDEGIISTVAGAVTSLVSVVTYIVTEGRIDSAAVKKAVDDVKGAIEVVKGDDKSGT